MNGRKAILLAMAAGLLAVTGWYAYRFLLHPEGISLAASEFCITNGTGEPLVFDVESKPGARIISFAGAEDHLCVPASVGDADVSVFAAREDGAKQGCSWQGKTGQKISLTVFKLDGNCNWLRE